MADDSLKEQKAKAKSLAAKYDELPYYGSPQEEQHISHLACLAKLFDIKAAPVENCRFLALGCGDGANMIPMALNYPESHFIGVDLSQNEIDRANLQIKGLKLKNIEIKHFDILDINKNFGEFDYIIAHGVYSWVPEAVRNQVLAVCRDNLSANGIALISYNCKPGFELRNMVRQMLIYHVSGIDGVEKMVKEARNYLVFLTEVTSKQTAYGQYVRELAEEVKSFSDNFFRHDLLGEVNDSFYFYQFISNLQEYNLQYITEADFHSTIFKNYSFYVREELENLPGNYIIKQQHLDFIQGRQFRQSIVCRDDKMLRRDLDKNQLENMFFASNLAIKNVTDDIKSDQIAEFYAKDNIILRTQDPEVKVLWRTFAGTWPKPQSFKYFLDAFEKAFADKSAQMKDQLIRHLLRGIEMGFINLYSDQPRINLSIEQRPKVNVLVRYQAKVQRWVTNQLHQKIAIDNLSHHILPLLDGNRDEDQILDTLYQLVLLGKINLSKRGGNLVEEKLVKKILKEHLDKFLALYRNSAFFI